jgi:glycosyltransferase involved in cell wall biosynthesis
MLRAEASAAGVNRAIEQAAPADVVLLSDACLLGAGWLARLHHAATSESGTATASALSDVGGALSVGRKAPGQATPAAPPAPALPRLSQAVGPCIYVSRAAVELVGALDESLGLRWALEVDFAQRCVLCGLFHVAADDVVVSRLSAPALAASGELPAQLQERYPYLADAPEIGASDVLGHTLAALRPAPERLWVTIDARALDGVVTGTQVHILELIRALAGTGSLRLRLLLRAERIDARALELLRGLPDTELLDEAAVNDSTPASPVFHRPQQMFSAEDIALAARLGERLVLSQLDLIAYRNPGYFPDARAWRAYRRASRHGVAVAERVVVFSDHTRRELLADGLAEDERIAVIPPGLDHRTAPEPTPPAALGAALPDAGGQPKRPYLLCLGTDFRHKNRLFALRLFAALRQKKGWKGVLVFAGTHVSHGSSQTDEHAYLATHRDLREDVIDLGSVLEEEKDWLVANAAAVVYPSAYEGFGLVPFESALRGVPCVFARQSSLADTAPEGTATIVPWDELASAESAYALITDPQAGAHYLREMARIGGTLTWAAAAAAMVEAYRAAAAAPVRVAATLGRDAVDRERELTATFDAAVRKLIAEREHETRAYEELRDEVGWGRSLVGPNGTLPENLQRALMALSARPSLSRPLFGFLASLFVAVRAPSRALVRLRRGERAKQ